MPFSNLIPWSKRQLPMRREEQHPIYSLQNELNRAFDEFFGRWEEPFGLLTPSLTKSFGGALEFPRIDVSETDKELRISAEIPGLTEKDIQLHLAKDALTITGEKKEEKREDEKGWYRMERQYGSFTRSIPLPYEVDTEKAEATFKNGVLVVTLPKTVAHQRAAKSIEVKKG